MIKTVKVPDEYLHIFEREDMKGCKAIQAFASIEEGGEITPEIWEKLAIAIRNAEQMDINEVFK